MQGYIKVWRKIMETSFYRDSDAVHLFIHLALKACHKDNEFMFNGQLIKLKRGQLLTGRKILSAETGISEQVIRTRLKLFEKYEIITVKSTSKYSIITLCQYETYQNQNIDGNQQITSTQPTDNQQITTNKNDNNVKNEKKKETAAPTEPPAPAGCSIFKSKANSPLTRACGLFKARSWCFQDKAACQLWDIFNAAVMRVKNSGIGEKEKQFYACVQNHVKQGMDKDAERLSKWANKMHTGE